MTIGVHASAKAGGAANTITSVSTPARNTSVSGSTLLLYVAWAAGTGLSGPPTVTGTLSGVADGNIYPQIGSTLNSPGGPTTYKSAVYECVSAAGGSTQVFTATPASGQDQLAIWFVELPNSPVRDQFPIGNADAASPYTSTTTGTTTQANETIVAFTATDSNAGTEVLTWGNSFATLGDNLGDANFITGDSASRIVTATGAYQSTFTSTGAGTTGAQVFIVTYKDASASPSTDQVPLAAALVPSKANRTPLQGLEGFAPVGALITTAALTSLGWFAIPHRQPPVVPQRVEVVAPVGAGTFALSKPRWIDSPQIKAQPQRIERPQPSQPTGPLKPFVSASTGFGLYAAIPVDLPLIFRQPTSDNAPIGTLIKSLTSIGWLSQAQSQRAPISAQQAPDGSPVGAMLPIQLTSLGWLQVDGSAPVSRSMMVSATGGSELDPLAPFVSLSGGWQLYDQLRPRASIAATPQPSAPVGTLFSGALTSIGWLGLDARAPILAGPRGQEASAPPGPLSPFLSPSTGFFGSTCVSPIVPAPRAQEAQQPVSPLKPFVSTSTGWLRADLPVDLPLISRTVSDSSPVGSLLPGALTSLGWLGADAVRATTPVPRAQDAVGPAGPLAPFVSPSTGFFGSASASPVIPAPRAQEAAQPSGPLKPFVSPTLGWMTADLILDLPLISRQVSDSSPVGTLLTPQPFSWNSALDQARPAPVVSRRVEPAAPIGTPFAIALPSNGWLATDNPRTPLTLGKSAPQDPVGNLLVLPPLPNLKWLATDNPRTPYSTTRAVVVDPVGSSIPLPGQHGPFWFIDQSRTAPARAPAVDASAPVGTLFATLTSIGWLSPFEAPRSPLSAQRPLPSESLRALQFGGAPWSTVDVRPSRATVTRIPETSQPIGSLVVVGLPGIGWQWTDQQRQPPFVAPRSQEQASPTGPLNPFVSLSSGWQSAEQQRTRSASNSMLQPAQAHSALAFGGTPWASFESAPPRAPASRGQETTAPVGLAFAGSLTSLGWLSTDAPAPHLIFPRVSSVEPVGLFMPPPVLPGMGWNFVMELPAKWSFVSRPIPSEPVGSSFALGFRVAPLRRCSPVFDVSGIGRLSPISREFP